MANKLLRISPLDSVAVAIQPVAKGETLSVGGVTVTALEDIPAGHKIALKDIREGEPVIKYGYQIGAAKHEIRQGEHVHTDNLHTLLSEQAAYTYHPEIAEGFKEKAAKLADSYKGKVPSIKA